MDLIEEIKLEYYGLKNSILMFTDQADIVSYLGNLGTSLKNNDIEKIKYLLKQVLDWYKENFKKTFLQPHVSNKETYHKYFNMLVGWCDTIKSYTVKSLSVENKNIEKLNKIFISHASADEKIGHDFLNFLIKLGVKKEDLFFSSRYHFGVEIGKDFHQKVKENLIHSNFAIFLLTNNFYTSEYCMHEMGAVWILDKDFVPILLDDLTYKDMKGFIDGRNIALEAKISLYEKFYSYLKTHYRLCDSDAKSEYYCQQFSDKVKAAYKNKPKHKLIKKTNIVNELIKNQDLNEDEILLLSFFQEKKKLTFEYGEGNPERDIDFSLWLSDKIDFNLDTTITLLSENKDWFLVNSRSSLSVRCSIDPKFYRQLTQLQRNSLKVVQDIVKKKTKINSSNDV